MHLYLYDRQHAYLASLIRMIRLYLPECTIHASTDLTTQPTSREQPSDSIVCLYNAVDFPDFDKRLYQPEQTKCSGPQHTCACHYIRLIETTGQDSEVTSQASSNHRLMKKKQLTNNIEASAAISGLQLNSEPVTAPLSVQSVPRTGHLYSLLTSLISLDRAYNPSTVNLNASTYEPVANQMICILSFGDRHVNKWIRQLLDKALRQGYRTVYLPLMPPYEQFLPLPPDAGPDLSDLLYRISVNLNADEKISPYWQSSENGWFQFRPPVRSDDLLCCHPDTIKVLVSTLKQKLGPDTEKSFIIIDCRHIPFSFVLAAATLCSHLFVHLPGGNKQAMQAAEKEAGYLANQMPGTCKVSLQKAEDLAC